MYGRLIVVRQYNYMLVTRRKCNELATSSILYSHCRVSVKHRP